MPQICTFEGLKIGLTFLLEKTTCSGKRSSKGRMFVSVLHVLPRWSSECEASYLQEFRESRVGP